MVLCPTTPIRLSKGHPSFESLSTSKKFVPVGIGDLVGGVSTCLPFVGRNAPLAGIFRGEGIFF